MTPANKLVFEIGADDRQFQIGMARVRNAFEGLGHVVGGVSRVMGLLLPAVSTGFLISITKSAIDTADQLNDLRQITGLSVKTLNGLSFAAKASGTDLADVAKGVAQFAKFVDAARNPTSDQARLLADLGINAKEPKQALLDIADVFAAMPDGMEKTALAMRLFGRAGANMIPLLNEGSTALQQMIDRGDRLAPDMEALAVEADQLNDNLVSLRQSAQGLGAKLAVEVVPGLNQIASAMQLAAEDSGPLKALLVGFGGLLKNVFAPDDAIKSVTRLKNEIGELKKQLEPNKNDFLTGEPERIKARIAEIEKELVTRERLAAEKKKQDADDAARLAKAKPFSDALVAIKEAETKGVNAALENQRKIVQSTIAAINKSEADRVSQAEKNKGRLEAILAPKKQEIDLNAPDESERYWNRVKARAELLRSIADARNALAEGNFDSAIKSGESAADQILALKEAGADAISTLAAQQKEIAVIQDRAFEGKNASEKSKLDGELGKLDELSKQLKALEAIPIGINIEAAEKALHDANTKLQAFLDTNPLKAKIDFSSAGSVPAPGFATGGYVSGPGGPRTDSILARLSNGEFVLNAAATRFYGPSLLDRLNNLSLPRFANGGAVPTSSGTPVHLHLPGVGSFETRAEVDVAKAIQKAISREALKHGSPR